MKPLRVYLSSTFQDLEEYRTKVFSALERAGLQVARMEGYTASDERPLDMCLRDVESADLYVGIIAWRYGYVPPAPHGNAHGLSITELEFRHAQSLKRPTLLFLAHPETKAAWPSNFVDGHSGDSDGGAKINALRSEISTEKTVSMFRSADELATSVLAALMRNGSGRRTYNIPPLRPDIVQRPALVNHVVSSLLSTAGNPGRNTLVLGGGGFGKTTLALMACHTPELVNEFADGMLWITLGENPDLAKALTDLYVTVAGDAPGVTGVASIAEALAKRLEQRQCLLVVDDVWRSESLSPFLALNGPRLLVTSRVRNLMPAGNWNELTVDDMERSEATSLLSRGLSLDPASRETISQFADKLGYWPLLLRLANARLIEESRSGLSAMQSIERVMAIYNRKGVFSYDRSNSDSRNGAVKSSVLVGLEVAELQNAGITARAHELSIFPEDTAVPVSVVAELWGLDAIDVEEDTLRVLHNLSVVVWDRLAGTVEIHDVIRLALALPNVEASKIHARLVDAWRASEPTLASLPSLYAWLNVAYHLSLSTHADLLPQMLGKFEWLQAKLVATDVGSLISDFDRLPSDHPLRLVKGALGLASSYLWLDKAQLPSQLAGRLPVGKHAEIDALLEHVRAWRGAPWLRPLRPTLHMSGGALERVFRGYAGGHSGTVRSIAIDGNGRWAVSAGNSANDLCVLVWNLATGTHQRLEGHALSGGVTPLAMSADGSVFISGFRNELRAWRLGDVEPFAIARFTDGCVATAVCLSADGLTAIAGTDDGQLATWALDTTDLIPVGTTERRVESLAITSDGAIAVSLDEQFVRVWNATMRTEIAKRPIPSHYPLSWSTQQVGVAENGERVVWINQLNPGGPVEQWEYAVERHTSTACPEGVSGAYCFHVERQRAIVKTRRTDRSDDGYGLLTFAQECTLVPLADIGRGISTAAISRDGRWAVTADYEHDVMLWNLDRAISAPVDSVSTSVPWSGKVFDRFADNGRYAVFGSATESPTVWDIADGFLVSDSRLAAEILAKEFLSDKPPAKTVKTKLIAGKARPRIAGKFAPPQVEGVDTPETRRVFGSRGHAASILGGAFSPDARFEATVSEDGTVRVWDSTAERTIAVFSDESILTKCVWAGDGRTLAVTDYRGRSHLLKLEGVT